RSRVSGVTIVATWRKGLPSQPPGRRSVVGRHLSDAGVAHPAALAGRDSLQSGTRVPQAPDDPTSRSRLRTTSGEPTCRSRRESISRNEESADHRSRSTRGIIRAHDSTGHDISRPPALAIAARSEEHTSELQSPYDLVCRLLLEKKKKSDVEPTTGVTINNSTTMHK